MGEVKSDMRLLKYLDDLVVKHPKLIAKMQATILRHLCWLNWHSQDFECSPYRAVMEQLHGKKLGFPRYQGRYWGKERDRRAPAYPDHLPYPYMLAQMEGGLDEYFGDMGLPGGN